MIRLPAPRLLPVTIIVTAILLGLKSMSLGQAALARDPKVGASIGPQIRATAPLTVLGDTGPVTTVSGSPLPARPSSATSVSASTSLPSDWPLLQELRQRRAVLERREQALDLRDAAIQAAARTLQIQLADLRDLRSKLESLEAARRRRSDAGWVGIVKLYEAMRPSDAATIFNALDLHLLVQILDRMNERKAALVMGNMDPERARVATQMLAIYRQPRNADPVATMDLSESSKSPGAG